VGCDVVAGVEKVVLISQVEAPAEFLVEHIAHAERRVDVRVEDKPQAHLHAFEFVEQSAVFLRLQPEAVGRAVVLAEQFEPFGDAPRRFGVEIDGHDIADRQR
jgi:hypothetical protein